MSDRPPCTCPYEERPLGRLHGIDMGRGMLRIATTPGCPEHDSCRGYTKDYRTTHPRGRYLYCPIHRTKPCPTPHNTKHPETT